MSLNWEDERYVRLYTRDTPEWCLLSWQARGLFALILRAVDRAGVLELGRVGRKGVAVALRAPWAEIEGPLHELIDDGCVAILDEDNAVLLPNFIDAQEARQNDRARQKASRERRKVGTKAATSGVPNPSPRDEPVTDCDDRSQNVTRESHAVTSGHQVSPDVTLAVLSCAEPSCAVPTVTARACGSAAAEEILEALLTHPSLTQVATPRHADLVEGRRISKGTPIPWVVAAIDELAGHASAADASSSPWSPEVMSRKLVTYTGNASPPRKAPAVFDGRGARHEPESPWGDPTPEELAAGGSVLS